MKFPIIQSPATVVAIIFAFHFSPFIIFPADGNKRSCHSPEKIQPVILCHVERASAPGGGKNPGHCRAASGRVSRADRGILERHVSVGGMLDGPDRDAPDKTSIWRTPCFLLHLSVEREWVPCADGGRQNGSVPPDPGPGPNY